jgi:glucose-6-phosphate 1-epimerase
MTSSDDSLTAPGAAQPAVVLPGRGGLPKAVLTAVDGDRAEVYLHGAHVTSWIPAGGGERLFLADRASFEPGAAIRGGMPVIFPQFAGMGTLPKHGFARTVVWELVEADGTPGGAAFARLRLQDTASTRELWPHAFVAELSVTVASQQLDVALTVTNTGSEPLSFTGALHSYFRVDDVGTAVVEGLGGTRYRDSAGGDERIDQEQVLTVAGEIDRVYLDAPDRLLLRDGSRTLAIQAAGFPDVVVWNPGTARARALPDLGSDAYLRMLCIEAAVVGTPVRLVPGGAWTGRQTLSAED